MLKKLNRHMSAYDIISKKRDKHPLTADEIKWFIGGVTNGSIADYQTSALLMAIFINGMTKEETAYLTDAMLFSGRVVNFDDSSVIDKHSTGGVGDKTSFIIAPLARACGVKVPMIAGRGLGHTGGTVDKFESIEGIDTNIHLDDFSKMINEKGIVLIGQTDEIAPADKKIYSLRDVTATINSIPLITASIMSKKLAEGASGIVMDIKVGNGAFLKKIPEAKKLARSLIYTANRFNRNCRCYLTDMNQPLGNLIGNSLELIECFEVLKNRGPKDITDLSVELASSMVYQAKLQPSLAKAKKEVKKALKSGKALNILAELIESTGGKKEVVQDYTLLPVASCKTQVLAPKDGYIVKFNTEKIGFQCVDLGGGRRKAIDIIDHSVGMEIHKKLGSKVKKGDPIMTYFHHENQKATVNKLKNEFLIDILKIGPKKPLKHKLIYDVLE